MGSTTTGPEATIRRERHELEALLRHDGPSFVRKVFHTVDPGATYLPNWHIDLMWAHLEALYRHELGAPGLIINIPPRYLKSICVSVAWSAWLLGHDPRERIVACSYAQDLALEHNVLTRLVLRQPWYQRLFPGTRIAKGQEEKREFKTTAQGHRQAASVGSALTGFGGNVLILDDPHNPKQAESESLRAGTLSWVQRTWSSRLDDKKRGVRVLVMQRLHERDATGFLLAEQAEDWTHLKIEAVATARTVIDFGAVKRLRLPGDLIHEAREGPEEIKRARRQLGEYGFAGQYQQAPQPLGGGLLKKGWWRRWPRQSPPECIFVFQSYDTAYTARHQQMAELGQPSYSARTTWGVFRTRIADDDDRDRHCLILLEAWRDQIEYPELRAEAQHAAKPIGEGGYGPDAILIEKKATGQPLGNDLQRAGLPVRWYQPQRTEDKVVRAIAASPFLEAGLVWTMDRSWADGPIEEAAAFPTGAHDDWTDTITQAVNWVCRGWWLEHPSDPDDPEPQEEARARSYG